MCELGVHKERDRQPAADLLDVINFLCVVSPVKNGFPYRSNDDPRQTGCLQLAGRFCIYPIHTANDLFSIQFPRPHHLQTRFCFSIFGVGIKVGFCGFFVLYTQYGEAKSCSELILLEEMADCVIIMRQDHFLAFIGECQDRLENERRIFYKMFRIDRLNDAIL